MEAGPLIWHTQSYNDAVTNTERDTRIERKLLNIIQRYKLPIVLGFKYKHINVYSQLLLLTSTANVHSNPNPKV